MILIKNARILSGSEPRDILIKEGLIAVVDSNISSEGCEIIDAEGLVALPGFVDLHCHLREPGGEYKDDIAHGVRSAAVGGYTDIACMPNTHPVIDGKTTVAYLKKMSAIYPGARVHPVAAASVGLKGEQLTEMFELKEAGAVAFSDDGSPISSPAFMRRALTYAKMTGLAVMNHCEELSLTKNSQMNEGVISTMLGLKGYPAMAEEMMISRDLQIAEYVGGWVHICHVSTEIGAELIRAAKAKGVRVTCEATPHHFSLTEKACIGYDAMAKVSPPLRTERDRQAIIAALADGTIDAIATDHAPHHPDEKNQSFDDALKGLVGFETAFSLAVTELYRPGHISLDRLIELFSTAPRRIIHLRENNIRPGDSADFVLCDLDAEWTVEPQLFESKAKNTPFGGRRLKGRIMATFIEGRQLVKNARFIG